jgi:hypothetical protein
VGSPWVNLVKLGQIESLGHKKRFGCWVELGLKANSCNPIGITLCKVTYLILVERRAALSPRVGHYWTGKQIIASLYSFYRFDYYCLILLFISCRSFFSTHHKFSLV